MIIGALICVLYIGVAAEPVLPGDGISTDIPEQDPSSDGGVETSSGGGEDADDTFSVNITLESSSSQEPTVDESSSSSQASSSSEVPSTVSRFGANATDPTVGQGGDGFGDPESDTTIDYASNVTSKNDGSEKNIFNLSKLLKGLIFIPITLMVASIAALIYVNRKEFAGAKSKKTDAKGKGGKHTRKKIKKDK